MPTLSIVTVVKDAPAELERTLDSVRSQGPADAELIVIDGSSQPVGVNPDIHFPARVIQQQPAGIYPAMNEGLAQATGRYVYFLNAGDTLADDQVITRILTGLNAAGSPTWAFGSVRFTDGHGRSLHERKWDYQQEKMHHFARGVFPAHQGLIAQTNIVRDLGGFDTRYRITADYALMLRLSQIADPIRWTWTIANFQQGGASSQHWWMAQREFHRARRDILQPTGWARLREQTHTARSTMQAVAGRTVSSMSA